MAQPFNLARPAQFARTVKRQLANAEEDGRAALGQLLNRLQPSPKDAGALFTPTPFAFRPYPAPQLTTAQIVSPPDGHYMHSFFDVPPVSPSGRYLLLSKIPFIWRLPVPGDAAELCVVDLYEQTIETIYRSRGWGMQLGINAQWHPKSDDVVFCNDLIDGDGVAVMIDRSNRQHRVLGGPLYTIDPKGGYVLGPSLTKINHSQDGYGVPVPSRRTLQIAPGLADDDGLWRTDINSGKRELLVSIRDLARDLPDRSRLENAVTSLFHCKLNPSGTRIMQVMRHVGLHGRTGTVRSRLLTLDAEGGGIAERVSVKQWDRGGHHPNWLDETSIIMNLVLKRRTPMRFVRIDDQDGRITPFTEARLGSGHPTFKHGLIITDCYHHEGFGDGDGLPLRLIDPAQGSEQAILHVDCGRPGLKARRIDPHPAWSRDGQQLIVNCLVENKRQTLLIDMTKLLAARQAIDLDRLDRRLNAAPADLLQSEQAI